LKVTRSVPLPTGMSRGMMWSFAGPELLEALKPSLRQKGHDV
jgi:hypothetical protein